VQESGQKQVSAGFGLGQKYEVEAEAGKLTIQAV
jgi:hypothetical protein